VGVEASTVVVVTAGSGGAGSSITIVGAAPAGVDWVATGVGEGTYTIRGGACRFGQPPMNTAKAHPKSGTAPGFISLEILAFLCQALSRFGLVFARDDRTHLELLAH